MNWGQIAIGIVIGAIAMWAIGAASKPAGGQVVVFDPCPVRVVEQLCAGRVGACVGLDPRELGVQIVRECIEPGN